MELIVKPAADWELKKKKKKKKGGGKKVEM